MRHTYFVKNKKEILLPATNIVDKFFGTANHVEWRKIFWFASTISTHGKKNVGIHFFPWNNNLLL